MKIKILGVMALVVIVGGSIWMGTRNKGVDVATTEESQTAAVATVSNTTVTVKSEEPKPLTPSFTSIKQLLPKKNSEARTTPITHVVVHFISNVSAKPSDPFAYQDIIGIFRSSGLSSHYLVERDGTVYQLTEENRVAYHAGKGELPNLPDYKDKLNLYSIGIEIAAIGTKQEMAEFITGNEYDKLPKSNIGYTNAQYASLNKLLNEIYARYPSVTKDRRHVVGHDEYAPGRKQDPGSLFDWKRIGF